MPADGSEVVAYSAPLVFSAADSDALSPLGQHLGLRIAVLYPLGSSRFREPLLVQHIAQIYAL